MGYAMGRTFVRLPQTLPAAMRQQLEEAGYTFDEAHGFADPETGAELKARIQAAIPKWMPERATELLKKVTVPALEELLTDQHKDAIGNFSPAQLDPADLLGLLRSSHADPSHLLAAIKLAVGFAQAHPGEKAAVEKA
jgi:hypothetical protein